MYWVCIEMRLEWYTGIAVIRLWIMDVTRRQRMTVLRLCQLPPISSNRDAFATIAFEFPSPFAVALARIGKHFERVLGERARILCDHSGAFGLATSLPSHCYLLQGTTGSHLRCLQHEIWTNIWKEMGGRDFIILKVNVVNQIWWKEDVESKTWGGGGVRSPSITQFANGVCRSVVVLGVK